MRRRLDLRAAASVLADGDATMAQVAGRLGVAKPTLYKLAGSRDALVRACVETEAERLLGHLHQHPIAVRAVAAFAQDSPGGFRLLFERRGPEAGEAVRRVETQLAELAECDPLRAAAQLGAAAAVVSRARATGVELTGSALDRVS
jgi:AcrR family transcriptional regulator